MNYGPAEMMIVSMARLLKDGETVFHGVASPLPMIAVQLAKRLYSPRLVYLNIPGGVDSSPSSLPVSTVDSLLVENAPSLFSLTEIFDLSARGMLDTAFISGVQIDYQGGVNLSCIGDFKKPKVRLTGGAGSAVILPTAKRVILWRSKHNPRVFVKKCDFVTARGNVEWVVTPLCIFRMDKGKLHLYSIHPYSSLKEVVEQTGFPIENKKGYSITREPEERELIMIDEIDPSRVRDIEFQ